MCSCTRHKWKTLPSEFCVMWEKMDAIQQNKNVELAELKMRNAETVKAYKEYRKVYKEITAKWQIIYEPIWDEFDDKFNAPLRG